MMRTILLLCMTGMLTGLAAQPKLPADVAGMLTACRAELLFPLDGGYKSRLVEDNPYFHYQYELYSRQEKMDIRFLFQPDPSPDIIPHLESRRLMMNICSNDDKAAITARDLTTQELTELFNADWGKVYLFPPKAGFGNQAAFCQMLTLFKEGRGFIHIIYLFNKPSPLVENRLYLVRFL